MRFEFIIPRPAEEGVIDPRLQVSVVSLCVCSHTVFIPPLHFVHLMKTWCLPLHKMLVSLPNFAYDAFLLFHYTELICSAVLFSL